MKRALTGALVGAVLVFGCQAISHMFLHHHDAAYKQVPLQDEVIKTLSGIFKEDGQYLIPRSNLNASQQQMADYNKAMKGKPFALVTYHTADNTDMGMAVVRSFTTAFLSVLIFIWIIGKSHRRFLIIFLKCLGLALLMFMFVHYNSNIWMQTPWSVIRGEAIDLFAAWGLCGLWLGYWLKNDKRSKSKSKTYGSGFGV